jgi:uncharacterized repeat protein (TIGR02059 family)
MPAQALRFKQFGWNAPKVNPVGAGVTGAALTIPFTQDALVAGAVTPTQFTVTVAGAGRAVNAASVAGAILTLTLASAVTAGQAVKVVYAGGGAAPLKDAAGDLVPPFTIDSVQNNTP